MRFANNEIWKMNSKKFHERLNELKDMWLKEFSQIIYKNGFERSEVAGVSDILESGGEVSKPSDLQIKYTADQDFGTNPTNIVSQNATKSFTSSKTIRKR